MPAAGALAAEAPSPESGAGAVIEAFLEEYSIPRESLSIGYRDTGTGEEYFVNPDQEMDAASLYKIPLNMCWAEKVARGEMDFETPVYGISLDDLMRASLVHSDNEKSGSLINGLGSYGEYRAATAAYYGLEEASVWSDRRYLLGNFTTARQMMHCLEILSGEPHRFPRVIDYMLEAEPEGYFRKTEQPWPVAQKYGFNSGDGFLVVNAAGIVYTDSPFLLVVLTFNVFHPEDRLSELCARLGEYTQERFLARATPSPSPVPTPVPTPAPTPAPTASPTPAPVCSGESIPVRIAAGVGTAILLAATGTYLWIRRKRK